MSKYIIKIQVNIVCINNNLNLTINLIKLWIEIDISIKII